MAEKTVFSSEPEDFHYMDINVPCQHACPADTNIPAYIRALYEENYDDSYDINEMANILPGVLGRICSRPCEDKCRHGESELGNPVNICHIKRAAADFREIKTRASKPAPSLGKKVAIIGAGPSGLAAAHDLACFGFSVTIFEAMNEPGGMLKYGIPEFRLPREILTNEISAILDLGVTLKSNIRIGQDISIDSLMNEYDAVLTATGCYQSIPLDVPGENLKGVHAGLDFMMDVCSGGKPVLGKRILVIGAGFTAFDCARTALRLGAKDVRICLRRTEQDLSVTHDEIFETKAEGIKILSLMVSQKILGDTQVTGVEFLRTEPGEKNAHGKSKITPIKGSNFTLDAEAVIVAVGQMSGPFEAPAEKNAQGLLFTDAKTFRTSLNGFYATGDYITGPSTVIEAISLGRNAARQIAGDLTGNSQYEKMVRIEEYQITDRKRSWDFIPRQEMPTLQPVEDRFKTMNAEIETGFEKDRAFEESKRCYLCYLHYEIDMDRCIYCRYCIDNAPRDCIKLVDEVVTNEVGAVTGFKETTVWHDVNAILIDNARCIRCGECVRVCPVDCISVSRVELVEKKK